MIGDLPKRAPLRCRLGRHIGQEQGGTMFFHCPRCAGTYWQARDYRDVTALGDALIAAGRGDEALDMARRAVAEGERAHRRPSHLGGGLRHV